MRKLRLLVWEIIKKLAASYRLQSICNDLYTSTIPAFEESAATWRETIGL